MLINVLDAFFFKQNCASFNALSNDRVITEDQIGQLPAIWLASSRFTGFQPFGSHLFNLRAPGFLAGSLPFSWMQAIWMAPTYLDGSLQFHKDIWISFTTIWLANSNNAGLAFCLASQFTIWLAGSSSAFSWLVIWPSQCGCQY